MTIIVRKESKPANLTSGYVCLSRVFLLLVKDKNLNFQELGFYLVLGMLMDWDPKHTIMFGMVKLAPDELSKFFGVSKGTVYRRINSLANKGLISRERGIIRIANPERFLKTYADEIKKFKISNMKELLEKEKEIFPNVQRKISKMKLSKGAKNESVSTNTPVKSSHSVSHRNEFIHTKGFRGSFKGSYKSDSNCSDEDLTEEDYKEIDKAINHST